MLKLKNQHKTSRKTKRIRLTLCAIIIASMFLVRWIMLQNGMITTESDPIGEEAILERITATEGKVEGGLANGYGTLLDITSASRNQTTDSVYLVTASSLLDGEEDTPKILYPDGTDADGEITGFNEEEGYAIIKTLANNQDSVYYSSNVFYQLQEGSDVYFLDGNGTLVHGSLITRESTEEGFSETMLKFSTDENENELTELVGRGSYSSSGHFIGTIEKVLDDGTVIAAPASRIVEYIKAKK